MEKRLGKSERSAVCGQETILVLTDSGKKKKKKWAVVVVMSNWFLAMEKIENLLYLKLKQSGICKKQQNKI